jgi:hypothetical protein
MTCIRASLRATVQDDASSRRVATQRAVVRLVLERERELTALERLLGPGTPNAIFAQSPDAILTSLRRRSPDVPTGTGAFRPSSKWWSR